MKIKLYGTSMCSRCKMAKMMLEKRNIKFDYVEVGLEKAEQDLPQILIDDKEFEGKDVLLEIRKMERQQ